MNEFIKMNQIILKLFLLFLSLQPSLYADNLTINPEFFDKIFSFNTSNTTETTSNETTTETPTEAPTTESPSYPNEPYSRYNPESDHCTCDLTFNWCDIDCCCDSNCTADQRHSFSQCIQTIVSTYDTKYCYSSDMIYINNAQTLIERNSYGLFCVVWDNVKSRDMYDERQALTHTNQFRYNKPEHDYGWNFAENPRIDSPANDKVKPIKSGDAIWVVEMRKSLELTQEFEMQSKWKLPTAIIAKDGECNAYKPVQYLREFESKCVRVLRKSRSKTTSASSYSLQKDCLSLKPLKASFYYSFFLPIKSTPTNQSIPLNEITSNENDPKCILNGECIPINVIDPLRVIQYHKDSGVCENVVSSVRYIITHNGTMGIMDASCEFNYINLTSDMKSFTQNFSVTFQWINVSTEDATALSGNPGYEFGKPLKVGSFGDDNNLTQYEVYPILTRTKTGFCHDENYHEPIYFLINSRSGCLLEIKSLANDIQQSCEKIQQQIYKILEPSEHFDHIGMFGNANASIISDWTLIHNDSHYPAHVMIPSMAQDGRCPSLVTGISLHFYYALVGQVRQPQAKVIGALKRYHTHNDAAIKCLSIYCDDDISIELSFSVSFYDITNPSRPEYSPPPVIKLQLPPDFFYPFMTSSASLLVQPVLYFMFISFILFSTL